jgi:hypothetical protein
MFESMGLAGVASDIFAQVSTYVDADPRREIDYNEFVDAYNAMIGWIGARPGRVRQILVGHGF